MGKLVDMTGKKFGRLTVIEICEERSHGGAARWHCKCGCGTVCIVNGANLRNGNSKSCGCRRSFRRGRMFPRQTFADEEYNDGLYQDEILGKY